MFILAEQFIDYLNDCEFAKRNKIYFAEMFTASLFAESRNCRMNEGHEKLLFNTAKSLFNKNIDEVCTMRGIYRHPMNERDINCAGRFKMPPISPE